MRTRMNYLCGTAIVGAIASACSLLVPLDAVQCNTSEECRARGGALATTECVEHVCRAATSPTEDAGAEPDSSPSNSADPWGCLDRQPDPSGNPNSALEVKVTLFDPFQSYATGGETGGSDLDLVHGTGVAGIRVRACTALDPGCAGRSVPEATTDAAGIARISVPGNFSGTFELTSNNTMATMLYYGRTVTTVSPDFAFTVLETSLVTQLGSYISVTPNLDPNVPLGHVFFSVFDCHDRLTDKIAVLLDKKDENTRLFYISNGFPSTSATATDFTGSGGFVNVPTGNVTITAVRLIGNRTLGSINVIARAGWRTFVWFRPRTR